jgi:hypothetical protein
MIVSINVYNQERGNRKLEVLVLDLSDRTTYQLAWR